MTDIVPQQMDEHCRNELPDAYASSQGPSEHTASLRHGSSVEKSVRFGENTSSPSPARYGQFDPRVV